VLECEIGVTRDGDVHGGRPSLETLGCQSTQLGRQLRRWRYLSDSRGRGLVERCPISGGCDEHSYPRRERPCPAIGPRTTPSSLHDMECEAASRSKCGSGGESPQSYANVSGGPHETLLARRPRQRAWRTDAWSVATSTRCGRRLTVEGGGGGLGRLQCLRSASVPRGRAAVPTYDSVREIAVRVRADALKHRDRLKGFCARFRRPGIAARDSDQTSCCATGSTRRR